MYINYTFNRNSKKLSASFQSSLHARRFAQTLRFIWRLRGCGGCWRRSFLKDGNFFSEAPLLSNRTVSHFVIKVS